MISQQERTLPIDEKSLHQFSYEEIKENGALSDEKRVAKAIALLDAYMGV